MRGVVPVVRRDPVVRALLLPRRAERGRGLVLGGGDQRGLRVEVGRGEPGDGGRLLLAGGLVVRPLEAEHARVVTQVRPDRLRRVLQHGQLGLRQGAADLPGVAALEAAVDQDAGGVHLLEEVRGHDVPLEPDRVHAHGLHQRDLPGRVGRRVVQEQVRVEAAAPDHDRHAVDLERAGTARLDRVGPGQVRRDGPDAERLRGGVVGRGALRHRRRQRVQRLGAHLVRPPDLRAGDRQAREAGRRERHGLGRVRGHGHALADGDRGAGARRGDRGRHRAGLRGRGDVRDVGLDGQRGAGQVGGVGLVDVGVADREGTVGPQLDGELDAGVVVRRDLGPVHVVGREHGRRVVGVDLDRERVRAGPGEARDVEA